MPTEVTISTSSKVHSVIGAIRSISPPRFEGRLLTEDGILTLGSKKAPTLSNGVRNALGKVQKGGNDLYKLRKLTPFSYSVLRIQLGENALSAETGLPLTGCIELNSYGEVRAAARDFLNISRFRDANLADEMYMKIPDMPITDPYYDTMLTALAIVGEALMLYSDELLATGNDWAARMFLKRCNEKIVPLLNPNQSWKSGLDLVNSLAAALDGDGGITSIRNLDAITRNVRRKMRGSDPLLKPREKYTNPVDEDALDGAKLHTIH